MILTTYIASLLYSQFSSCVYLILPTCTCFAKLKTQDRNIGSSISRYLVAILWSFCVHTTNRIKTCWPTHTYTRTNTRPSHDERLDRCWCVSNKLGCKRTQRAQPNGKILNEHLTGRRYIN